jgi:hypothetical protein
LSFSFCQNLSGLSSLEVDSYLCFLVSRARINVLDLVRPLLDLVRPSLSVYILPAPLPSFFLATRVIILTIAVFVSLSHPSTSFSLLSLLS